jgi:hypothetical protein
MFKIALLIAILINTLLACNKKDEIVDSHIEYFSSQYELFPTTGWEIKLFKRLDNFYTIQLDKSTGNLNDSSYYISYDYFKSKNEIIIITNFLTYKEDSSYYLLEYRAQPIYLIRSSNPFFSIENRNFIYGKYHFQYLHDTLTEGQKKFFKLHSDSLGKIRGNKLPPLPEI